MMYSNLFLYLYILVVNSIQTRSGFVYGECNKSNDIKEQCNKSLYAIQNADYVGECRKISVDVSQLKIYSSDTNGVSCSRSSGYLAGHMINENFCPQGINMGSYKGTRSSFEQKKNANYLDNFVAITPSANKAHLKYLESVVKAKAENTDCVRYVMYAYCNEEQQDCSNAILCKPDFIAGCIDELCYVIANLKKALTCQTSMSKIETVCKNGNLNRICNGNQIFEYDTNLVIAELTLLTKKIAEPQYIFKNHIKKWLLDNNSFESNISTLFNNAKAYSEANAEVMQIPSQNQEYTVFQLIPEFNHDIQYGEDELLISLIERQDSHSRLVIAVERDQSNDNLSMVDVKILAEVLKLDIGIPRELSNSKIYYDALLLNAADAKNIKVVGVDYLPLKTSDAVREKHMVENVCHLLQNGYDVSFAVGESHYSDLEKHINYCSSHSNYQHANLYEDNEL